MAIRAVLPRSTTLTGNLTVTRRFLSTSAQKKPFTVKGLTSKEVSYARQMPAKEIGQQLIMHAGIVSARAAAAAVGPRIPSALLRHCTISLPCLWETIFYAGPTAHEADTKAETFREQGVGAYFQDAREESTCASDVDAAIRETSETMNVAKKGEWVSIKPTAFILKDALMAFDITKPIPADHPTLQPLLQLLQKADENGLKVSFDAEQQEIQPFINAVCETLQRVVNKERAVIFNTFQTQLGNGPLDHLLETAKTEGFVAGVKCVNGAYRPDYSLPDVAAAVDAYAERTSKLAKVKDVKVEVICCTHHPKNTAQAQALGFPTATLRGMSNHQSVMFAGRDSEGNPKTFVALFFGDEEKAKLFVERRTEEALDMHSSRVWDNLGFFVSAAYTKLKDAICT